MSSDASTTLSLEIQQALQQAVGNVNDAANVTKKKKKKRGREQSSDNEPRSAVKKAKKKREKKHRLEEDSTGDNAAPEKQKEKKDKGKGRAQLDEAVISTSGAEGAPLDDDIVTSSADFLSAIVAAANATSQPTDQQIASPPQGYQPPVAQFPSYHEHYLSYSPAPTGYSYPAPGPYTSPQPHMVPQFPAVPIPELNIASSEELLQTLQSLDITKITSVLKSLGEAGAAANISLNIQPQFVPSPPPPHPPSVRQVPAKSDAILGHPLRPTKECAPSNDSASMSKDEHNPDHAHMLANVWMNAAKLAEMVKTQGLVYKKGKFSATEVAQLTAAIKRYQQTRGVSDGDLVHVIFSKDKSRDSFWTEITSALHLRPIIAVYHHVRRTYHPMSRQGRWTPAEDAHLRLVVSQLGLQWELVAVEVGRAPADCRDRYRNHIVDRDKRVAGNWSKEEEDLLTKIVTDMTVKQDKSMDNDIFWGKVSALMGGRRGRQQCRIKWTDCLSIQYKNDGERPRWGPLDAYLLVRKIDSLNVCDDSEIDWKTLPDEEWNYWSAHSLQRRWITMKRSIKGHEEMSHAEIMDILRTKKAQSPPPITNRKRPKVTSAEAIDDSDEDSEGEEVEVEGIVVEPSNQIIHPPIIAAGS